MKKLVYMASAILLAGALSSCGGGQKTAETKAPEATKADAPEENVVVLFDGSSLNGWRGYNKDKVPARWTIEDGCLKFNGTGKGEGQNDDGGDIIFDQKFQNFELTFDWKVAKGSNSGVFYLAQEIPGKPIYYSAPEYQILDNANHPDAKLGKDGNRQSASLYDMIPAKPQNSKPFGEWNTSKILCYKGTIVHYQNDEPVVEYHLWTPEWKALLDVSKFKKDGSLGEAYDYLLNCGGENHEGFIGFQDHGDDVWFRNIKVKILE